MRWEISGNLRDGIPISLTENSQLVFCPRDYLLSPGLSPTTIVSARSHYKRGGVDVPLLKSLAPLEFLGVVAGAVLGGQVKGEVLTLIFAIDAILVAINMTFRRDGEALAGSIPGELTC
jgi:uncharacterized membrane protein YfcA